MKQAAERFELPISISLLISHSFNPLLLTVPRFNRGNPARVRL
jgi:hypothetical protein